MPEPVLFAAVLETDGYIVGAANARSGLFRRDASGTFAHLGWRNGRPFGFARDPRPGGPLYLACGNGVLRSADDGRSWRVTTDWRLTEALALTLLPDEPDRLVAATAYGIRTSPDRGDTWHAPADACALGFTQTVEADHGGGGLVLAGTETGLIRSTDGGHSWARTGPDDLPVRHLAQHPLDPDRRAAATEDRGLWRSRDGGRTWQPDGTDPDATFYAVAFSTDGARLAAAGYRTGIHLSEDDGAWTVIPTAEPGASIHALAFDPFGADTLWVGVVRRGLYRLDVSTRAWTFDGLPGASIRQLAFAGGPA